MISFSKYKIIFWDFDGVLIDSMPVRDRGFEIVLQNYPAEKVDALLKYHRQNGGLSRYVKFRYFFEQILQQPVTDQMILDLSAKFSEVMRQQLTNPTLLINDAVDFVRQYHKQLRMHVVSGSDQNELRFLCTALELSRYFVSIHGSPTPKKRLVAELLQASQYHPAEILFIGDSHNDEEAASVNGIDFMGYNNTTLAILGAGYIDSFCNIIL